MLQSLFVSAGLVACLFGAIRQEYQRSLTLAAALMLIGLLLT
ncbi:hypothetical protein [Paraburkholderia phytofirmans]|nr:hypothetical protein [Paraburkholderia phytofirmans]